MNSLTDLIKSEIKKQYGNVLRFSQDSGIPYGTLQNALTRGVGGTSYDTITKICTMLNIKQIHGDDSVLFNQEFYDVYKKLTVLDEMGVHTVCTVLNVEYQRCMEKSDPKVKGFQGISIVQREAQIDESRVRALIKKAQRKE